MNDQEDFFLRRMAGVKHIRIQADQGNPHSVLVTDAETGEWVPGVKAVEYRAEAGDIPRARVIFFASNNLVAHAPAIDVIVEAEPVMVDGVEVIGKFRRWLHAHEGQVLDGHLMSSAVEHLHAILERKDR